MTVNRHDQFVTNFRGTNESPLQASLLCGRIFNDRLYSGTGRKPYYWVSPDTKMYIAFFTVEDTVQILAFKITSDA